MNHDLCCGGHLFQQPASAAAQGRYKKSSVKNSQAVDLESGKRDLAVAGFAGKRAFGAGFLANLICD
jgi:hypothetical protein